jgi:SAM-dependent methyltransferase
MSRAALDTGELVAIWHDVECGSYEADLCLWERLADDASGPVLDLGCGTGRVALHLARRGHAVTGVDLSAPLIAELDRRAAAEELPARGALGDARELDLGQAFGLVLAPMQLIQVLGGDAERIACLRSIARHLAPMARGAVAVAPDLEEAGGSGPPPLPDVREIDGWICSSLPIAVRATAEGFIVTRLRQTVSPAGEMSEERSDVHLHRLSAERLAAEAAEAGLTVVEEIEVAASEDHVGSVVAILEAR